jgi:hypothetical protein
LDEGERCAIALAVSIHADLILMDDRVGVAVARRFGSPSPARLACSISRRDAGW